MYPKCVQIALKYVTHKDNLVPRARDLQGKNRELWDNP